MRRIDPPLEVIVQVGSEGGSIALFGLCDTQGGWHFCLDRDESTLAELLPDDLDPATLRGRTGWVASWEEALGLLDRYPWHCLYPLDLHPEFRERILAAVAARAAAEERETAAYIAHSWEWADLHARAGGSDPGAG